MISWQKGQFSVEFHFEAYLQQTDCCWHPVTGLQMSTNFPCTVRMWCFHPIDESSQFKVLDYSYVQTQIKSVGGRDCTVGSTFGIYEKKKHYCRCYCGGKPEMAWRIRSFWKCPRWRWWGVKIDDFINGNSDRNAWLEIVRPLWWRRWQVWVGGGQVCEVLKWQLNEWIEAKPVIFDRLKLIG